MGVQKEASSSEKQWVALGRTLQALREEKTTDGLISAVLDYLQAEFAYPLVWFGLYDRSEHRLMGRGGTTPNGQTGSFLKQRITLSPGDVLEQVVVQRRPVGLPDLREELRMGDWNSKARQFNIQGTLIYPIHYQGQCLGVVLLGSHLWGTSPRAEEKARLSMVLGELAAGLYHQEAERQRQQAKRPDQPLFNLLKQLRSLPTLKKRLEATISETQRFIQPDRTNIYWLEPHRRSFSRRIGNRSSDGQEAELSVQDLGSVYHTLSSDQILCLGEAQGSLRADGTARLMQQIQARSLIAAPIAFQGELRGFLTVEGNDARLWTEDEKNYVRGVAQLVALVAPLDEMEEIVQQVKQDQSLTAELTHALYSDRDWQTTLKTCTEQLCQRLKVERVLVLLYAPDRKIFEIYFQNQSAKRRLMTGAFEALNSVDWQMLERSPDAIGIDNLEDDLKLIAWRQPLLDQGLRSLLVCSTAMGKPLEGVMIVGHDATRRWNRTERDLLRVVSQQVGLLLHQLQLQRQTDRLQTTYDAVQSGLSKIQRSSTLESLEQETIQHIATILQVPLTVLLTWQPGQLDARPTAMVCTHASFNLTLDQPIRVDTDGLIHAALQAGGLLSLGLNDLTPETRQWLSGSEIDQILVMPLGTAPEHQITAVLVLADRGDRTWGEPQLSALTTLANQLAWNRRALSLSHHLLAQRDQLQQLNWYKQRRMEEIYRTVGNGVKHLNELSRQKESTASRRYSQILSHLSHTLAGVTSLLKHEQWQFHPHYDTTPLASLLRRSLERIEPLIKQRQIWCQVHNDANVSVGGDIPKIEFILSEILIAACQRSVPSGRIDIWCRQLDDNWLELAVTDKSNLDPQLIEELHHGADWLAPSLISQPPGLHLALCRSLMQRLGGDFALHSLEEGGTFSRLVVAIATEMTPMTSIQMDEF